MKNALFLTTEAFPRIEHTPISLIKKEGEVQDKNVTKVKLSCTPQVWVTSLPQALRTHLPNILWRISLIPTEQTPGNLSRPISQPTTMALYAAQGGYVLASHHTKVSIDSCNSQLEVP